ncbi:MAG: hypothetical protein IKO63_07840 [Paludibacteraceae bacterium]|nr:hypothetical protein [Paludibacteraceae bacterium]
MLQRILAILIIAGAAVGLWAYIRNERRHSCACGGSCSDACADSCGQCALKQQCEKMHDKTA